MRNVFSHLLMIAYLSMGSFCSANIKEDAFDKAEVIVKGKFVETKSGFATSQIPGELIVNGKKISGNWATGTFEIVKSYKGGITQKLEVSLFKPDDKKWTEYSLPFNQMLLLFLVKEEKTNTYKQVDEGNGWLMSIRSSGQEDASVGVTGIRAELLRILEVPDMKKNVEDVASVLVGKGVNSELAAKISQSQYVTMFEQAVRVAPMFGINSEILVEKLRQAKSALPSSELFNILKMQIEHGDFAAMGDVRQLVTSGKIPESELEDIPYYASEGIKNVAKNGKPEDLKKYWDSQIPGVRVEILRELRLQGSKDIAFFTVALEDPNPNVAYEAIRAIKSMFPEADFKMVFLPAFEKDPEKYVGFCKEWLGKNGSSLGMQK